MDYLKLLNESYETVKSHSNDKDMTRHEFLAEEIFGFETYENVVSTLMAQKCVEVCLAISAGKTGEYIVDTESNFWYLVMVNMPFIKDKICWGSSIRCAFWDFIEPCEPFVVRSCGFYFNGKQIPEIVFNKEEWDLFVAAMGEFATIIDIKAFMKIINGGL